MEFKTVINNSINMCDLFSDKINTVICEPEGIITDGLINISETGSVLSKNYCLKDFEAINLFKSNKKYRFIFLSTSNNINYNLFDFKNIPFFWSKKDKLLELDKILRRYSINFENIIFFGSLFSDIQIAQKIPFSVCLNDAPYELQDKVAYIFKDIQAGQGGISALYSLISSLEKLNGKMNLNE